MKNDVSYLIEIFIGYLSKFGKFHCKSQRRFGNHTRRFENLENFVANLKGDLEILQGDLKISFEFPTSFLTTF